MKPSRRHAFLAGMVTSATLALIDPLVAVIATGLYGIAWLLRDGLDNLPEAEVIPLRRRG